MKIFKKFKRINDNLIKSIFELFLLCSLTTTTFAHGTEQFSWTIISTSSVYDIHNDHIFQNIDLNLSFLIVNCSFTYKNITYMQSDNFSIYAGFGVGSTIQVQFGFSTDGKSMKIRYDILLGRIFREFAKKNPTLGLITITPSIEHYNKNSNMDWYVGLGIGFSINNAWGLNYFK